jgi:hypothetical protein
VRELRERLRLAQQAILRFGAGASISPQELERHTAIELRVVGEIDLAHAAAAELVEHEIAADSTALPLGRVA